MLGIAGLGGPLPVPGSGRFKPLPFVGGKPGKPGRPGKPLGKPGRSPGKGWVSLRLGLSPSIFPSSFISKNSLCNCFTDNN